MGGNALITSSPESSGDWLTDIISVLALIVSLISIWYTHRSVFAAKQIDVKFIKFDKMCLQGVESIFSSIDKIFIEKYNEDVVNHRNTFTDIVTELNIFFTGIKGVYTDLNINAIGVILDAFTDNAYQQPVNTPISALKGSYYSTKTKLYEYLFNYSISFDLKKLKTE